MIMIILDYSILSFMYVIIAYLSSSRPLSIFGVEVRTAYMRYAKHSAFSSLGWMTEHTVWEYIYITRDSTAQMEEDRSDRIRDPSQSHIYELGQLCQSDNGQTPIPTYYPCYDPWCSCQPTVCTLRSDSKTTC